MRIEKLTENKIRILLNMDDLREKNIDYHSFMSNSLEAQNLFLEVLEKAEEEIGFSTKDYKLLIEAIATSEGYFILTVTRVSQNTVKEKNSPKKLNTKRQSLSPNRSISIYSFNTFDDFCDFCTYLNSSNLSISSKKLKKTSLYTYNLQYYFVLCNISFKPEKLKAFHCLITEFRHICFQPRFI